MVSQEKRIQFRQEIKKYSEQELREMKSRIDSFSPDKQAILLEELQDRDKHQEQLNNKELQEEAKNANKIGSLSNIIAVLAVCIPIVLFILSFLMS